MSSWRPGEPISARKLNAHSASQSQSDVSGMPGSFTKFGSHTALNLPDLTNTGMWVRVTSPPVVSGVGVGSGSDVQEVSLHSWEAIYWNDGLKKWQANPAMYGNATPNATANLPPSDYDAIIASDLGNLTRTQDANLTADNTVQSGVTPYFAVRDPVSRRLIAVNTQSSGQFQANSSETVLMILGTYDEYKDCPDVPPSPPTTYANYPCSDARTSTLCVPAYAYAVYQRCGYVWNKIGDTRTYGVWATEMNGQSFSAWRRLVIPRWGGNFDPATGLPDPDADCMGVAFLGTGAGSALTCSCPPCLVSPPEGKCLIVKFRTASRPETFNECGSTVTLFDQNDLWDKEIFIPLSSYGCIGDGSSSEDIPIFEFEWQPQDGSTIECDWGPEVFDPCDPCAHWARLYASINISDDNNVNCANAGHWRGEFRARDVCELLCDCASGPVTPVAVSMCDGCGNNVPPIFYFIDPASVEIICCPDTLHDSAESLPLTIQDTGGTTFGFQDSTL